MWGECLYLCGRTLFTYIYMYDFGDYNPEKFDPGEVEFRDSTRRKKRKQQKR